MKRNVFYGALLVLLLGFLVRENRLIHIPKQVEKTEESAEWQPEWYEQIFISQPNRINISQDKDVKFKMKEYLPL